MTTYDDIEQQAAQWFAAQRRGPMSLDERQAFDVWRRDPLHQAALNRMHETWGELSAITEAGPSLRRRTTGRRQAIAAMLVLGLTVGVGAGAWWGLHRPTASTGVGEQRSQELPDGSIVAMNVLTRTRYDISQHQRVVNLDEGEATFVVHRDPDRPFLVRTAGFEVRAVGTAFNVRSRDRSLDVAVKEGVVEVRRLSGGGKPVFLRAGQRLMIKDTSAAARTPLKVSSISAGAVDEWRQRVLTWEDAPVADVIREVNRFYERPIVADAAVAQRHVTLRLVVDDRADTIKRLAALLDAKVQFGSREDRLVPAS